MNGHQTSSHQLTCKGSKPHLQSRSFLILSLAILEKFHFYIEQEEPEVIFQHVILLPRSVYAPFGLSCCVVFVVVLVADEAGDSW